MGSWVRTPGCFINGFSGPNPWLFYFSSRPFGACFIQPNPMISMPTSPSASLLLFIHGTSSILTSRASRTHRPLVTTVIIEVDIFHAQLECSLLCRCNDRLHLLSRELHHVVFQHLVSCTRQSSVFNAKTRSSVPSAPLNRHYQCTHFFTCFRLPHTLLDLSPCVAGNELTGVKVSKLVHFQPDFWTFARAVLNHVLCALNDESNFSLYSSLLDLVQ